MMQRVLEMLNEHERSLCKAGVENLKLEVVELDDLFGDKSKALGIVLHCSLCKDSILKGLDDLLK
jgi:hypothetical protein